MSNQTFVSQEELQEMLAHLGNHEQAGTRLEDVSEVTGLSTEQLEAELKAIRMQKEIEQLKQEINALRNPPRKKGLPMPAKLILWAGAATLLFGGLIVLIVAAIIF